VVGRLRVLDDMLEAREMRRTQEVVDVGERRLRQHPQRVARDDQNLFVQHALDAQPVGGEFSVRRLVLAEREQRRVPVGGRRVGGEGSVHGMKSNWNAGAQIQQTTRRVSYASTQSPIVVGAGTGNPSALGPSK